MGLIKLIKSLSPEEQERLSDRLIPAIKARKDYMHFRLVVIPNDLNIMREVSDQRTPLLQSKAPKDKAKLADLDQQLTAIREKIKGVPEDGWVVGGHQKRTEELNKARKKAVAAFTGY